MCCETIVVPGTGEMKGWDGGGMGWKDGVETVFV